MSSIQQQRRKSRLSFGTIVATVAITVGTYHLAKWAWENLGESKKQAAPAAAAVRQHVDGDEDEEELIEEEVYEEEVVEEEDDDAVSGVVRFRLPGQTKEEFAAARRENKNHTSTYPPSPPHLTKLNASQAKLRRQRLLRCRDETTMALGGFLLSVRRMIEDRTDTLNETRALKKLRGDRSASCSITEATFVRNQENDLWERIKVRSLTRLLASAYAHTILFLVLTVQVNLLGGRLFEEQIAACSAAGDPDACSAARMGAYQESHRFVLSYTYEHFFEHGLDSLIHAVERAVADVLKDWNVLDASSLHMSREQFEEGLLQVRAVVEKRRPTTNTTSGPPGSFSPANGHQQSRNLLQFLMPPSETLHAKISDELARSILDETWDLLESPVMEDALADSLSTTFDLMRELHWGAVFEDTSSALSKDAVPVYTTRPLATVLTKLKKTASSFYECDEKPTTGDPASTTSKFQSSYCATLQQLPAVNELAGVSFT